MKEFKGRVLNGGYYKGEAVVSHQGVNTLASFQSPAIMHAKKVKIADQNNPDIFQKNVTGKALCLPQTIGSTTGGMVLQVICSMGINPACLLFSEHIDSLAGAGVILSVVWENSKLIAIDQLGQEFLDTVKTGDTIEVTEDGTVRIL
ncbi:MAG: DUF126 domain-containing protein [Bacteroidales bacterium]|nr:DUF126 domain-containing protein [Candidatus Cryptobacteroides fimicaballi]